MAFTNELQVSSCATSILLIFEVFEQIHETTFILLFILVDCNPSSARVCLCTCCLSFSDFIFSFHLALAKITWFIENGEPIKREVQKCVFVSFNLLMLQVDR